MNKFFLPAAIAAGAAIAYTAWQGKLQPAIDKAKDIPFVAKTIEKVQAMRKSADNDDPMMNDQAKAA